MSRIRADRYTNRLGTGAPTFSNGVNITGNVGVGTTVPTSKLTVVGNMNVTGTVSVGGTLTYEDVTSIDSVGIITAQSGIHVPGGGNLVGIGTTNPLSRLHVSGTHNSHIRMTNTSDDALDLIGDSNRTSANSSILAIKGRWNGTDVAKIVFQAATDTTDKDDGNILFHTKDSGSSIAERLRITSTGITSVTGSLAVNGENYPTAGALSNRNLIVNGSMLIAQRGTSSFGTTGIDTVDRFKVASNVGVSRYQYTLNTNELPWNEGLRKYLQIMNASSSVANSYREIDYKVEAQDLAQSGWKYNSSSSYITLSFWVRASVSQTYYLYLRTDDGTDRVYSFPYALTANTWKKVVHTIPGDSNIAVNTDNGLGLLIRWLPWYGTDYTGSSATNETWRNSTSDYVQDMTNTWANTDESTFDLTGVQLEVGEKNTPFENRPISEELLRCQRYFIRQNWVLCNNITGIAYRWVPPGPSVNMRTSPAMSYFHPSTGTANQTYEHSSGTVRTINSSPAALSATSGSTIYFGTSTNGTYGQYVRVHMDAEL
tara:strand:- start:3332 stop:4957 length:1626 start_codon:yes stop_codon:yes gene_type:complete